ncbi:MAG: ABC transporter permease [Clostridia bacterium]|nr:ABC transporter permease [Clostridia bacterium]
MGRLFYLIGQGFENVLKNKLMFIASVFIITTTLIMLGIFTIVGENANALVEQMKSEQRMQVWLDGDLASDKTKEVGEKLKKVQGVDEVVFRSKKETIDNMRELYFDESTIALTDGWEDTNIYATDSYIVTPHDLTMGKKLQEDIEKIDGVNRVAFQEETFTKISKIADIIKVVVLIILIFLIGLSFLVISNTIKLGLHARRKEINIMKYIGATDNFVKTPFVIEAIIVGLIGALVSWLVTIALYDIFKSVVMSNQILFEPLTLDRQILTMNVIIGTIISCFACLSSINKYLKV